MVLYLSDTRINKSLFNLRFYIKRRMFCARLNQLLSTFLACVLKSSDCVPLSQFRSLWDLFKLLFQVQSRLKFGVIFQKRAKYKQIQYKERKQTGFPEVYLFLFPNPLIMSQPLTLIFWFEGAKARRVGTTGLKYATSYKNKIPFAHYGIRINLMTSFISNMRHFFCKFN